MKRWDTDEGKEEMVSFLLKRFNDRERIKPDSYLCLSCKHYKPRKGECKKIKGFLGEDFAHGDIYSAICPEYEPGKEWQWLKKTKTKAPALTCGECIHEHACAMWNTGTITHASAEHCEEFKRTGTCWDCKHYDREEEKCLIIKRWFGEDILGGHEPDDFCSKIERRENDENN